MYKIVLDAGHGPDTPGKRTPKFEDGTFMHEHEFNNTVVQKLKSKLNQLNNFSVTVVSSETKDVPLAERVQLEREIKADLFLSVHANALTGKWGTQNGIESYSNTGSVKGAEYCKIIQADLISSTCLRNRGAKTSSFYVLKNTYGPAVLVECGFMDNKEEAKLLMSDDYREKIAQSLFDSICKIFKVNKEETKGYLIENSPTCTLEQMRLWAKNRNADPLFIEVAHTFYKVATSKGCDPAVVYAQAAKETGFFKFGGVIDKTYHNTCGLKIKAGGGNYDPDAHMKFDTWEDGISAHVDHLLLYAGASGYPSADTLDPRHFVWIYGKAKTVEELSGKWAPSMTYGQSIVNDYIQGIISTKAEEIDYKAMYEETKLELDKANEKLKQISSIIGGTHVY